MKNKIKKILSLTSVSLIALSTITAVGVYFSNKSNNESSLYSNQRNENYISHNSFSSTSSLVNNYDYNGMSYNINLVDYSCSVNGFYNNTTSNPNNLVIPSEILYKGIYYAVKQINNFAFYNSNISSVSFPDTLTSIGECSFANNYISSLTFPQSLLQIGNNAFSNNMFHYGTVVYLPSQVQWNKQYNFSPFDTNNNYSDFSLNIQYVVQNQAVYTYSVDQNGWHISSYMPSIANLYTPGTSKYYNTINYVSNAFTKKTTSSNTQQSYSQGNNFIASQVALPPNSIDNNCIYFNGTASGAPTAYITFNSETKQIELNANKPNQSLSDINTLLGDPNGTVTLFLNIFNPDTGKYSLKIDNFNVQNTTESFAKLFNNSISFNYGDIITFQITSGGASSQNIGVTSQLVSIASNYSTGMNTENLNNYYILAYSTQQLNTGLAQFRITPNGLVPYVNLTHINPIKLIGNSNTISSGYYDITGTSVPNSTVTVIFNEAPFIPSTKSYVVATGEVNSAGELSVELPDTEPIWPTKYKTYQDLQPGVSSYVVGIETSKTPIVTTHFVNDAPINTGFALTVGTASYNGNPSYLLIDINSKNELQVYYTGGDNNGPYPFPFDNNPTLNYAAATNWTIGSDGGLNFTLPTNEKFNIAFKVNDGSVVDIPLTNGMSISTFNSELNKVVVQPNDTLSIFLPNAGVGNISVWNSNIILNRVFSNGVSIPFTFNTTNSYANSENNQSSTSSNSSYIYYKFTLGENSLTNDLPAQYFKYSFQNINSTSYTSSYNPTSVSYFGGNNVYGNIYPNYGYVYATNYMVAQGFYGGEETYGYASNWFDPTSLIKQVALSLTNGLATTLQKAEAIESWVATNIKYVTSNNTYDRTLSQTFQELEGMCGSYAHVASALMQMVGIVSRVIGGSTSATSPWTNFYYTNHAWNQVWIPNLEEWITFDPTWNWLTPVGTIQNALNVYRSRESVCLTMFPTGSNYYSYFENAPYAALNELGQYFGVNNGDSSADYPLTNGILFAKLLSMTNTLGVNGNLDQLALYLFPFSPLLNNSQYPPVISGLPNSVF